MKFQGRLIVAVVLTVASSVGFAQPRERGGGHQPARAELRQPAPQATGSRYASRPQQRFEPRSPQGPGYPGGAMRPTEPVVTAPPTNYGRPSPAGEPSAAYRGYGAGESPSVMPGETISRSMSQSAADRAQQINGGGRVLAVQSDGNGYRVKLLKNGEVQAVHVPY